MTRHRAQRLDTYLVLAGKWKIPEPEQDQRGEGWRGGGVEGGGWKGEGWRVEGWRGEHRLQKLTASF